MTVLQDLGLTATARLGQDSTLTTPVLISLFSDARATEDDQVENAGTDLRGWWGDCYLGGEPGDSTGSLFWTLHGGPIDVAQQKLPEFCAKALEWMITDGYITAVETTVERTDYSQLALHVRLTLPSGTTQDLGPFTVTV
jgi:phage gp46-like protein